MKPLSLMTILLAAVVVLFVHELAHYVAASAQGCDAQIGFGIIEPFGPAAQTTVTCPPGVMPNAELIRWAPLIIVVPALLIAGWVPPLKLARYPFAKAFLQVWIAGHIAYLAFSATTSFETFQVGVGG